jgi:hypothetical protein
MLKIISSRENVTEKITIDSYVPFTIEFYGDNLVPILDIPLYWRGIDNDHALIEIGLNKDTGTIHSIVLVTISPDHILETQKKFTLEFPSEYKFPIFNINLWLPTNKYKGIPLEDFPVGLKVEIGLNYISVFFSQIGTLSKYIINDRVYFGIDNKSQLVSIHLIGLNEEEINTAKVSLQL